MEWAEAFQDHPWLEPIKTETISFLKKEYAYHLVNVARQKRVTDIFKLDGNVFSFDSTTIDLCLAVFWWAKFRRNKGGIKVHTLYDLETRIPAFFHITDAAVHDSKAMKEIPHEIRLLLRI